MKKNDEHIRKKEKVIDSLKLPKDICMGAMKVTMTGSSEAWIENYRGLLEYTEKLMACSSQMSASASTYRYSLTVASSL